MSQLAPALYATPVARMTGRVGLPVALLAIAALLIGVNHGVGIDAAVYTLYGDQVRAGFVPYLEIWGIKPPGLFVLSALNSEVAARLGLESVVAWRALAALAAAGIGWAVFALLRQEWVRWPVAAYGAAAGTILFSSPLLADGGGLSEPPAFALGLGAWAIARRSARLVPQLAAVGAASSAVSISLLAAPMALLTLVAVVRRRRTVLMASLLVAAAVPISLATWLAGQGALNDAWRWAVEFNRDYVSFSCQSNDLLGWPCFLAERTLPWTAVYVGLSAALLAPLLVAPLVVRRLGAAPGQLALFGAASLIYAFPLMARQPYAHYLWPGLIGLLPVSLVLLDRIWDQATAHSFWRAGRLLLASLSAAALSLLIGLRLVSPMFADAEPPPPQIVEAITSVDPAAPLLVWGSDARLYLESDRAPLSGILHLLGFAMPGYITAEDVDRVCRLTAAERPIIVEYDGKISLQPDGLNPRGVEASWLAPLRALVATEWRAVPVPGMGVVYEPMNRVPLDARRCD